MNAPQKLKHFDQAGLAQIPEKLLALPQAITWVAGVPDPITGKFTKYPKGRDGTGDGWPKPPQWIGTLAEALQQAHVKGHCGPGVVLPALIDGQHLVALDWDGVDFEDIERMNKIMQAWEDLGRPYMEISPSGKGLRAFVLSAVSVQDASRGRPDGGKDELFCSSKARWMTVTGRVFKAGGLPDATDAVVALSGCWNDGKPSRVAGQTGVTRLGSLSVQNSKPLMLSHLLHADVFAWPDMPLKDGDGREEMMLRYAGHLRQQKIYSQGQIEDLCLAANVGRYSDPLPESVVLDRAKRYMVSADEPAVVEAHGWAAIEDLPPKFRKPPALDPELLPQALSGYVADCAKRMRIPAEMIATPILVALGSVFGKKVCVQPRNKDTSWIEFANLWGVSILPPAMLKSPSMNAAMKFISELEAKAQRDYSKEIAEWDSEERVRKLEVKVSESVATKAIKAGNLVAARQELDRIHNAKPPIRERYIITDATPEARLQILCDNPNGVLLLRDELDGHIAQLRKDGYENARAQELQFFDGHQDYSDDRIKRGSHIAEGPRMALYGNLQPAKVEKYLREMHRGGSDDGYLQRMLQLAVQPTIEQAFELHDNPPDQAAELLARRLFQAAQAIPLERNGLTKRILPRVLTFDAEAQEAFDQFLVKLENTLRSGKISNPVMAAHFGKYRGTLPKLALIMALAENPAATTIPFSAFEKAERLLIFYKQHAERVYGVVKRYNLASAYELLDRINKGQVLDGFNPRDDIQRKEWEGLRTSGEIEAAVDLLSKHGHIKVVEEPTTGRPKRLVRIHPELLRQKGTKAV
jgi:hypothetical protein